MQDGHEVRGDRVRGEGSPLPPQVGVRPARDVRLVEYRGVVTAYPGPHRVPVLPAGWAPLTRDQQAAALRACDEAYTAILFRIGSLWDPGCEYRVYRLASESWAGLTVATKCALADPRSAGSGTGDGETNKQLLGLGREPLQVVRIAIDFFNWDLEAHGQTWRLDVQVTTPSHD
jgi:hypothetical protein